MATKKTPAVKISLDFGDSIVKATGATVYEALSALVRPTKITGKVFLEARNGTRAVKQMYMPVRAKRLFYPQAQLYIAKQLEHLMR